MDSLEAFVDKHKRTWKKMPILSWYGGVYRYLLDTKKVDSERLKEMIEHVKTYQSEDGGFRIITRGSASSVIETAIAVDFLVDAGENPNSEVITNAVKYLCSQQRDDGGFSERKEVSHPTKWDDEYIFEKRISTPHITAWVLRALLKVGFSNDNRVIGKALKYLSFMQKKDGGWSHFRSEKKSCPYLTGLILIALGEFDEFRKAVNIKSLEEYFSKHQKDNGSIGDCLDASLLVAEAWANLGLHDKGSDTRLRKLLEWIQQQQNDDGSFIDKDCGWPDTIDERVNCSMNVLRVFYKNGWVVNVE